MTLLFLYVLVALGFSFLCSIAEAVILSLTPFYIKSIEAKKPAAARLLYQLNRDVDRPLAAILSLNTIAHTVGAVGVGAQAAHVFDGAHVGVSSAVLTLLILVLSEIIPKTLGATYWRGLAPYVARIAQLLIWFLLPLVWLSERMTQLLSKGRKEGVFNRDEFTAMAELGEREGQLEATETRILRNLFRFDQIRVEDIMTPRVVVFALPESITVGEVLREHPEVVFSRIPVFGVGRDDVTGIVLKTDLLLAKADGADDKMISELKRPIKAIPETARLSEVFEVLLTAHQHLLIAVDEYGGLAGVVTIEDVIETLIGIEIVDEADQTVDMRKLAREHWKRRVARLGLKLSE